MTITCNAAGITGDVALMGKCSRPAEGEIATASMTEALPTCEPCGKRFEAHNEGVVFYSPVMSSNPIVDVAPSGEITVKPWVFAHLSEEVELTVEQLNFAKQTAIEVYNGFHLDENPIDWNRLFERVEAHTDLDLGAKWDAPHMKKLKAHVRTWRNEFTA